MLFTDWTLLRLFPPLRAAWAPVGSAGTVVITGENAKAVLFGAINARTGHRVVLARAKAGGADARAFLLELRLTTAAHTRFGCSPIARPRTPIARPRLWRRSSTSSSCGCRSKLPNSMRWINSGEN